MSGSVECRGSVAGVVLAAGAGRRLGGPKAGLVVGGRRLLERAVDVLHAAGCDPLVAVVRTGTQATGVRAVVNPRPERGMRSSLEIGLDAVGSSAADPGADAIAVLVVDTPGVTADAARAAVAAWRPGRIAVATYAGRRGHPIVMAPQLWRAAVAVAAPDEGARAFLRAHPELVDEIDIDIDIDIDIACAGAGSPSGADDIDTPDDLVRWSRLLDGHTPAEQDRQ